MANTHAFETKFSKRMQSSFYNLPIFPAVANMEERDKLRQGQSVTRPYRSTRTPQNYTRGSDLTVNDMTDTSETITINTVKADILAIDHFDELQSNYRLQNEYADDAAAAIAAEVDGDFLAEAAANATLDVDDGDIGGTAGNPIALSTANVVKVFTAANRKLRQNNVDITGADPRLDSKFRGGGAGYCSLSPEAADILEQYAVSRETVDGDRVFQNGYCMKKFNFDHYISNNNYWSAVLGLATQVTANDTVVINGVTFTFVASPSAAGDVDIGSDVDATAANLAALINDPATTTAGGVALSAADQELLKNISATVDATANTVTVVAEGKSFVPVSETLSQPDGTDGWSNETQHLVAGKKGGVDMVMQAGPGTKVDPIPKQFGVYVKPYVLYGKKLFNEGKKRTVVIKLDSSGY